MSSSVCFSLIAFLAVLATSMVSADPQDSGVCNDLMNIYDVVPELIRAAAAKDCYAEDDTMCNIIKGLLMEKSRQRIYNLRASLKCVEDEVEPITVSMCEYLTNTPAKATKLVKEVFPVPFNVLPIRIATDFEKDLITVLEPLADALCL